MSGSPSRRAERASPGLGLDGQGKQDRMPLEGEYEPSPVQWVRDQVEAYERSGGREANTLRDTGLPVIVLTTRGRRSNKLRKSPLMRVEHEGRYALVAS